MQQNTQINGEQMIKINYQKTQGYVNKNSSYLRRNLLSLKTIKIVLKQIIFSTQHRPYRKEFDSIGNFNCESNS